MQLACDLGEKVGLKSACAALSFGRAGLYRMRAKQQAPTAPVLSESAERAVQLATESRHACSFTW